MFDFAYQACRCNGRYIKIRSITFISSLVLSIIVLPLSAEVLADDEVEIQGKADEDRFFKPGGVTATIFAGGYQSAEEDQFSDLRAEYVIGLGVSADLNKIPHLALDFELFNFNREYTTSVMPPDLDEIDNDTKITTNTYMFGARAYYQVRDLLRVYAVLGFGYYETRMLAPAEYLGLPVKYDDNYWSFDMYAGAGIIYMPHRWGLGLDYRYFDFEGDFPEFEVEGAQLGGDAIMLGLRYLF